MKVQNAIKKLEKAGFVITKGCYNGVVRSWSAKHQSSKYLIEFLRNGISENVICIKVRAENDISDIQSDYHAGIFVDNISRAIRLAMQ